MQLMYQLSITAGAHSVDLSSAYFVPDALTTQALTDALRRGVKIRIITPRYRTRCVPGKLGAAAQGGCQNLRIPTQHV